MRSRSTTGFPTAKDADITASVKEVYEKVLPPVDDELARAASEFETLAELREEIQTRLGGQLEEQLEAQFRTAALDALVAATDLDVAPGLVQTRAVELWNALVRSLERRGISPEVYVQLSGRTPEQIQSDIEAEARQALEREIVLEAAADKLGLEVSDEDVDTLIREQAEDLDEDRRRADRTGPRGRAIRSASRRPPSSRRARPDLRRREAHPRRARGRPRQALDPREGKTRDRYEVVDPR